MVKSTSEIANLCGEVVEKYRQFLESATLSGEVKIYGTNVVVPAETIIRNTAKELKASLNKLSSMCNDSAKQVSESCGIHL